ncbi:hypothetical protein BRE01_65040 [Brevibacillus reuszeri]|uniref:Uncharacterized protein n=1 Tax=Brevibacillus reuszeri TaxID=54915 RepID=A0ABQ0TY05_9BACL|nr:hypothetical protein BRE01_65040 [Brevibacillus reuszeri]
MFRQQVIASPIFNFGYDGSFALVVQRGPSLLSTATVGYQKEKPTSANVGHILYIGYSKKSFKRLLLLG